jgi:hypothetical protein
MFAEQKLLSRYRSGFGICVVGWGADMLCTQQADYFSAANSGFFICEKRISDVGSPVGSTGVRKSDLWVTFSRRRTLRRNRRRRAGRLPR